MSEYDAGDTSSVDRTKNKFKLEEERNAEYLRSTLETYNGRACLWNLIKLCGLFDRGFTGDNSAYYNEGRRDVGLTIKDDIEKVSPHSFSTMLLEASERDNRNKDG